MKMDDIKVVFMGTPDFAVNILSMLNNNYNVCLVVTKPDKIVGKGKEKSFSPVKKYAMENNIPVFQPEKIREDYEIISEINPDIIITCAYGQILSEDILNIPKLGCINVHASLLPKYRGSAPIQWSILNGDEKTGITIMYMDKGMDTGNIISQEEIDIDINDNVGTLHDKLSNLGTSLLEKTLPLIINGTNESIKQDDTLASSAPMIKREDELLDFNNSVINVYNKIRAFSPWPLTHFSLNGVDIKIVSAHFEKINVSKENEVIIKDRKIAITCQDGIIILDNIKPFGKGIMDSSSYLNGLKDKNLFIK